MRIGRKGRPPGWPVRPGGAPPSLPPSPAITRRRRLTALAVLLGVLVAGLAVAGLTTRDADRPLPEGGGSRFGTETTARAGTLLDALAPLLLREGAGPRVEETRRQRDPRGLAEELPLSRAVAQLFVVAFEGTSRDDPFFRRLRERDWGGVLLDELNLRSERQFAALAGEIGIVAGEARHLAPLVAVRQEGGPFNVLPGPPPAAERLGSTRSPARVREAFRRTGRYLRELNVTMDLAPVADVAVEGAASFGRALSLEPGLAGRLALAAVRGLEDRGVIAAPVHFPGQGGASQDPSDGPATVGLSLDELRARDLRSFAQVLPAAPAVVVSNALYVAYDGVTPAVLLPEVMRDTLRGQLGFRGVVMTDDLGATTLATGGDVADVAVRALQAGADLLLVPGSAAEQEDAYAAVLAAVRRGDVPEARVRASVGRILALKRRFGLLARRPRRTG